MAAFGRRRLTLAVLAPLAVGFAAMALWLPGVFLNAISRLLPYNVTSDIAYGDGVRKKLDVYLPPKVEQAAVIVFFYGGSWQAGAKESYGFIAATLAERGYAVVVPDYRVYPEVTFPEFLKDAAEAVRWTKENIAGLGGDPARIYLMGHSAGAYIAAMLTNDEQWLHAVGLDPLQHVAGLIGVAGPYDFLPLQDETLKLIFHGDRQLQTQPVTFVRGQKPPALLVAGAEDNTVLPRNSRNLASILRREGNAARDVIYPHFGHVTILAGLAPFLSRFMPILPDIDAFVTTSNVRAYQPAEQASRTAAMEEAQ